MAFPFHSDIQLLAGAKVISLRPDLGTAFPASPVEGQIFYRSDTNKLYVYDGANWVDITGGIQSVNGIAPIVTTLNGSTVDISITLATTSADGAMSSSDKAKLDNATSSGTANTLVLRDANGDATFNMLTITGSPTNATDVATVAYVDSAITSISWLDPAIFIQNDATDAPVSPISSGDRYVITNTASLHTDFQGITGLGNGDVIEYDGSQWNIVYDASVEGEGGVIYIKQTSPSGAYIGDIAYRYNGTDWVEFFNVTVNSTGSGLYEQNGAIHVGAADDSITINPDDIAVKVDNITIETAAGVGIRVKDGGITYSKINTSLFDSTIVGNGSTYGVANYTPVTGTTVARVYKTTISIGGTNTADKSKTITHNLNNDAPTVIIQDSATNAMILADVSLDDANNVTISVLDDTAFNIDVTVIG